MRGADGVRAASAKTHVNWGRIKAHSPTQTHMTTIPPASITPPKSSHVRRAPAPDSFCSILLVDVVASIAPLVASCGVVDKAISSDPIAIRDPLTYPTWFFCFDGFGSV